MHYLVNRASVFFSSCLVSLEALYLITVHISQISLTLPHSSVDPFVNWLPLCSGVCCKCQLQVAVPHIIIIIGSGSGSYIMLIIHFTLNDSPALSHSPPLFFSPPLSSVSLSFSLIRPHSFVVWEKFCSWHRFVIFMAKHFHRKLQQRQRETSLSDLQALSLSYSKI